MSESICIEADEPGASAVREIAAIPGRREKASHWRLVAEGLQWLIVQGQYGVAPMRFSLAPLPCLPGKPRNVALLIDRFLVLSKVSIEKIYHLVKLRLRCLAVVAR